MNRKLVAVIHPAMLACALLVAGCAGNGILTADTQTIDSGKVLVNDISLIPTQFRASEGRVDFVGSGGTSGNDAAMFSVGHGTSPLERGESVLVAVQFKPTRLGAATAQYDPSLLSGTPNPASFPMRLSGEGVGYRESQIARVKGQNAPPDGQDFGDVCVRNSDSWTFSVNNTTTIPVELSAELIGPNTRVITVTPAIFTVPASGAAVVVVTFAPRAPRAYNATLVLTNTDQNDLSPFQAGVWIRGKGKNC